MTARLEFQNVTMRAAGKTLLGPVDLTLSSAGITVIMGPNGAGKSLFLSASHGILAGLEGRVLWNGEETQKTRQKRGYVFQNTPILRRSVAANIAFSLRALNHGKQGDLKNRISRALIDARLEHSARKPAAALSGGERKRLDLARAMVASPEVLMLDEPAANLDPGSTRELESALKQISQSGVKILICTHDVAQARRLADDVLFFSKGEIIEQANADIFFDAPKTEEASKFLRGEI